jgi:hypothetical protein
MMLFFQQWYGELLKLFARRRTYIGFGAFVALEIAHSLALIKKFGLGPMQRPFAGSGENVSTTSPRSRWPASSWAFPSFCSERFTSAHGR